MPRPAVAFDLTPVQNAHRFRGIGTYVRGLAARLNAQDEVAIEFWGWRGEAPFTVHEPHTALWLRRFPMPGYRGAWVFARAGNKARALRSPAAIVHLTDPDGLTPLPGKRLMATVYDLIPLLTGISRRSPISWAGYRTYLRNLRRVERYFAISRQTAADLVAHLRVPPEKVVVAFAGIDLELGDGRWTACERPFFLYVGGPNPNKNLGLLLEAMAAAAELPEELLVVGRWLPRQLAALERHLESARLGGHVRHLGFVPQAELVTLIRQATALVVPSLQEGFGLPVGEALKAGAAVVHSRIPVLEEVSNGAALTFDPRSAEELAARLRQLSAGGRQRAGLQRRALARGRELTWDAALAATLATYRELLAR